MTTTTTIDEEADGDCFVVAAEIILSQFHRHEHGAAPVSEPARMAVEVLRTASLEDHKMRLVHGLVTRHTDRLRHGHAWIEVAGGGLVVDFSNGNRSLTPAHAYYRSGEIDEVDLRRYTRRECLSLMLEHETYGPWEERFNEYVTAA